MTIGGLEKGMCHSPEDLSTIFACQWQQLDSPAPAREESQGPGQPPGRGLGPRPRHRHSACPVGRYVYVFGGREGTSPRKDVWRFHVDSCQWEAVELQGASLPHLQGHTSVPHKELVLVFGGTFSDSVGDVQLWTFDTDTGQVEELRFEPGATQPSCRRDHSAVIHNTTMYVYGGFVSCRGANQELWAFDIDEREWRQTPPVRGAHPGRRYSHTMVVADNAMWLFGGLAGLQSKSDLWRYSFLLHQWKKVKALGSPPCLSGHAASVVHRHMVVVGGKCQGRLINEVWCFSFDTSAWQQVTQLDRLLPCLSFHTCVSYCLSQDGLGEDPALQPPSRYPSAALQGADPSPHILREKSGRSGQCGPDPWKRGMVDGTLDDPPCCGQAGSSIQADSDGDISDMADPGVHVSLTQALLPPASPQRAGLPREKVSRKAFGYEPLKEEARKKAHPGPACFVLPLQSSANTTGHAFLQASPACESLKPLTQWQEAVPDLIDLSEPTALGASSPENGSFFDVRSFNGAGGFSSPCPWEMPRPVLSPTKEAAVLSGGLVDVPPQWSVCQRPAQPVGSSDRCPAVGQQAQSHGEAEVKPAFQHCAADRHLLQSQPVRDSAPRAGLQAVRATFAEDPAEHDLPCQAQCPQQTQKPCYEAEAREQPKLSRPSQSGAKKWFGLFASPAATRGDSVETDTSLVESETEDDALLISTETEPTAEGKRRPGTGVPRLVNSSASAPAREKKPKKSRDARDRRERGKGCSVHTLRGAVLDVEFMLVLGGHMKEMGSGLSTPMPVWKGVLM